METSDSCGALPGQAFWRFMADGNNLETWDSLGSCLPLSCAGALFLRRIRGLETSETLKPYPVQAFSSMVAGANNLETGETLAAQRFHKNHKVSLVLDPLRSIAPQWVLKNHKFLVLHVRLW
jgi:hypothetical protein